MCQCHAFRPPLACIFGKQDGGLGKQADNHNQTGLHVDVVLQTEEPCEQETAHQPARHCQQNRKGNKHAFVQGTQNHIDQDHTEQEYQRGIVGCLALLARDAAKLVGVICRENLACRLTDGFEHLPRTVTPGRRPIDGDGIEQVEAGEV